jgi:hypothetical protein
MCPANANVGNQRQAHKPVRPRCGSDWVCRSWRNGIFEQHVLRALHYSPYYCDSCNRKFYRRRWGQRHIRSSLVEQFSYGGSVPALSLTCLGSFRLLPSFPETKLVANQPTFASSRISPELSTSIAKLAFRGRADLTHSLPRRATRPPASFVQRGRQDLDCVRDAVHILNRD